jgi:hypothetical protein
MKEPADKPVGPLFLLGNGTRVAIGLRYTGTRELFGEVKHVWTPVIEGDVLKLMPMVHGFDAEYWPPETSLLFPSMETPGMSREWAQRLLTNSPVLVSVNTAGVRFEK